MSNKQDYVQWFRGAAPYIKVHRQNTFVIMISDEVIYSDRFIGIVHDIALLNHLGIKLVLLHGSRSKIDSHLTSNQLASKFHQGIRISDVETLPFIIQAINEVKIYFESHLSMGLPNTPMSGSEISLISGNFVTGMPLGVIDGVDMLHSGKVRAIKHAEISALLDLNNTILLSNIGYSRTGEVFNLPAEELASEVAIALQADKLIYIHPDSDEVASSPSSLSGSDCERLLNDEQTSNELKSLLFQANRAIRAQVKRVHLLGSSVDGGLLLELFTRDGYGMMITNLFYEGIRSATINDIGGILELIQPLEASGILIERSREQLELEIIHFQVIENDGMIIACIASIPDAAAGITEIACLAVHQHYQNTGLANQLLTLSEDNAGQSGIHRLYTLTTRTSHWFLEHGFVESDASILPALKSTNYNPDRGSKILLKTI
jgi:amino-acid N-acetyltransferase